jgi:small subunit ribosomal protein S21
MANGPKVEKKDRESINSVLRRFRRACSQAGLKTEIRKRRFCRAPSVIRKLKKSRDKRMRLKNKRKAKRIKKLINTKKRRG